MGSVKVSKNRHCKCLLLCAESASNATIQSKFLREVTKTFEHLHWTAGGQSFANTCNAASQGMTSTSLKPTCPFPRRASSPAPKKCPMASRVPLPMTTPMPRPKTPHLGPLCANSEPPRTTLPLLDAGRHGAAAPQHCRLQY